MNIAIVYILIAVVGSAAGQLLLKKGMSTMGPLTISLDQIFGILWRIGTNPYVVIGLTIYVCGTVFWLAALSRVDLSFAYPFASLSYIAMIIGGWLLFSEKVDLWRIGGSLIIMLGVILISQSGK
ncbi:MAG: EamA family transporter [Anaerolineales bacterium]|nr:EamA family transporter [Anaerolineales bacterium]